MTEELFSTGKIATTVAQSPAKVKKAIGALGLEPVSKRGVCAYYSAEQVDAIKAELQK